MPQHCPSEAVVLQDAAALEIVQAGGPEAGDVLRKVGPVKGLRVQEADELHDAVASVRDHAQLQHALDVKHLQRPVRALVLPAQPRPLTDYDAGGACECMEVSDHASERVGEAIEAVLGIAQVLQAR